jgi:hypothetical protein
MLLIREAISVDYDDSLVTSESSSEHTTRKKHRMNERERERESYDLAKGKTNRNQNESSR